MTTITNNRDQIRRVLTITLLLNLLVATGKIVLGVVTGALAITADGFHSLTDSAGNIAGLIATALAARPPDANHPYGHHRFETLAALAIGGLLLLTAWEMLQGVFERWQSAAVPELTPLAFAVLLVTLLINIGVSRYQMRAGKRLNSEIICADAQNTQADVFVTLSVIVSMGVITLTGWAWLDIVVAAFVAFLIGRAAWGILHQTGRVLVDTAPYAPEILADVLHETPVEIVRARSRGTREAAQIDIDIGVPPHMTADQTHNIAQAIRQQLTHTLDGVTEIEVHFVPQHQARHDPVLIARACADRHSLTTHDVQLSRDEQGSLLEMHVEVPPQHTLAQAHHIVTALEGDLLKDLPEVGRVVTHIEPQPRPNAAPQDAGRLQRAAMLCEDALNRLQTAFPQAGWHDAAVRPTAHGYALRIHTTLPPKISVQDAHALAESAEMHIRATLPDLTRITIHTEPEDHA